MRTVLAIALLFLLVICTCSAQTPVSGEVRARVADDIDKIAASRRQRITGTPTVIVGPALREVDLISVDPDLLLLMQGESSEYRDAVIEQLADADPVKCLRAVGEHI